MSAPPPPEELLALRPTLPVLLLRDGFVCHLCGGSIPVVERHDPMRATRDHLIPRSRYPRGLSKFECQALLAPSHARCNLRKGNSIPDPSLIRWDLVTPWDAPEVRRIVRRVSWAWNPLPPGIAAFLAGGPPPRMT